MKPKSLIAFVSLGTLLIAGCQHSPERTTVAEGATPKKVTTALVGKSSRLQTVEQMGTVNARHHADIETRVQARVERIPVALGTPVHGGDVLAELDTREFRARVQQARAVLEQAAQDLARFETLLAQSAVTEQEYDGVKARKTVAEAGLSEAEAMLSYARITAPFAGTVTSKTINVGDLVVPGRPLFVVEDETSLQFVASIPEAHRNRVELGDTMQVAVSGIDDSILGIVDELSPSSDPASHTFAVKISLSRLPGVRAGQFGRLLIPTDEETSVSMPRSALVQRGQLEFVYVATADNRAALRFIRTGHRFQETVEALAGLIEGERVVLNPQADLSDGDWIEEQS